MSDPVPKSENTRPENDLSMVPPANPTSIEEYRKHIEYYRQHNIVYDEKVHGYHSDSEGEEVDDERSEDIQKHVHPAVTATPKQTTGRPVQQPETVTTDEELATMAKGKSKKVPRHLKTKHRKINRDHPEFELTYDMMLGIRTTVSFVEAKPYMPLKPAHLKAELKLRFPGDGSSMTPAHEARDFKFKDYMPEVFRRIRARFDIDPAEYLMCVCGNFEFLEFLSNSKSGQFFFYSHDRRYMIKTITQEESKFLRKIQPAYYDHVMKNPNTFVTRFFGMHRVKPHKKNEKHFLIMGSVFYTKRSIDRVYDLKGSTQGRSVRPEERQNSSTVFKDQDFLQDEMRIHMGPMRSEFLAQLERDVEFLRKLDIMDYSLLIGIHDVNKHQNDTNVGDEDSDEELAIIKDSRAETPVRQASAHNPSLLEESLDTATVDMVIAEQVDDDGMNASGSLTGTNSAAGSRKSLFVPTKYNKVTTPQDHQVNFHPEPTTNELLRVSNIANANNGTPARPSVLHKLAEDDMEDLDEDVNPALAQPSSVVDRRASASRASTSNTTAPSQSQNLPPRPSIELAPIITPDATTTTTIAAPKESVIPQPRPGLNFLPAYSVFNDDDGGFRGVLPDGSPSNYIYYAGIIDILTVYNMKKRLEHVYKSFKYKKDEISAVPPKDYGKRFLDFIGNAVD